MAHQLARAHGTGQRRVRAIGADHDARLELHGLAVLQPAADAAHAAIGRVLLAEHVLEGHAFAQLGACGHRGVQQNLVQHHAPWRHGRTHTRAGRLALQHQAAHVQGEVGQQRATTGLQRGQHAPAVQQVHARVPDQVGGQAHIAGEMRLIDDQHAVTLAGQQECGGGTGAARAHNNGIEHGDSHTAKQTEAACPRHPPC